MLLKFDAISKRDFFCHVFIIKALRYDFLLPKALSKNFFHLYFEYQSNILNSSRRKSQETGITVAKIVV
jgi:hypothetical protein